MQQISLDTFAQECLAVAQMFAPAFAFSHKVFFFSKANDIQAKSTLADPPHQRKLHLRCGETVGSSDQVLFFYPLSTSQDICYMSVHLPLAVRNSITHVNIITPQTKELPSLQTCTMSLSYCTTGEQSVITLLYRQTVS